MYSLTVLLLSSLGICLLVTPLCRDAFLRAGLVDAPDAGRKRHLRAVPRTGGIAIAIACLASFGILLATGLSGGQQVAAHLPRFVALLPPVLLVFLTGLVDDLAGLRPWQKLAGQLAASALAYGAGVRITGIAGVPTADWWWSLPLTLLWLVACTNAFNLIDGVDGLAAGIGLCATLTTLLVALLGGDMMLALATAPLAGALAGFLRYNFNPASIFLGDCGSLLVGFLLGCYGVLWSQKSATWLGMTAPLMVLAVPLADTVLAITRRFLRGDPVFHADRGHIHHRLLDRGWTPRRVALLLYACGAAGATLSIFQTLAGHRYARAIFTVFCVLAILAIRRLGYREFGAARQVLLGGAVRRLVGDRIRLDQFHDALLDAPTPADCWSVVRASAPAFGLTADTLALLGESFAAPRPDPGTSLWSLRLPLDSGGWLSFRREADSGVPASAAAFADEAARILRLRLPALRPSSSLDPGLLALARGVAAARAPRSLPLH